MTLSAEELRSFVEDELDRRDWTPALCARRCEHPDPDEDMGIHRNAAYQALKATGKTRVGTLLRMAEALGFKVERTYSLRKLGIVERRRLHGELDE